MIAGLIRVVMQFEQLGVSLGDSQYRNAVAAGLAP
jgi:hypothetical protein